jgi:hypothetical protein
VHDISLKNILFKKMQHNELKILLCDYDSLTDNKMRSSVSHTILNICYVAHKLLFKHIDIWRDTFRFKCREQRNKFVDEIRESINTYEKKYI